MADSLKIITFKYGTKYTPDHVQRLNNMLRRHVHMDFEFIVIADDATGLDGLRVLPLWDELRGERNCGVRLKAFDRAMADFIGPRFAWTDLDLVIVRDATHIFSRTEDFVITATPRPPLFYNGSLVMMNAGAREHLYTLYNPRDYVLKGKAYGTVSDEGWIGAVLGPGEATWTKGDGVYYYRNHIEPVGGALPDDACIVLMNGKRFDPSRAELQRKSPWIEEHWR